MQRRIEVAPARSLAAVPSNSLRRAEKHHLLVERTHLKMTKLLFRALADIMSSLFGGTEPKRSARFGLVMTCIVFVLGFASPRAIEAQSPAAAVSPLRPTVHIVGRADLSGTPSKEGVTLTVDWPAESTTGRHFHHGDEYGYVVDGSLEVRTDGAPPRIIHSGESYHNSADVVHETRNPGPTVAHSFTVFIVDKGKPLSEPVP